MQRRRPAAVVLLAVLAGCGADSLALIQQTSPPNGATSVDRSTKPTITVIGSASIDLLPPQASKVVLYDVTGGARQTMVGSVLAAGSTITYEASTSELPAGHTFELVIKKEWCDASVTPKQCRATISDEEATNTDGSEWPEEPLTWPYVLRFSTTSAPRLRAAYLEGSTIHLRFSQPMNPIITQQQIRVTDIASSSIALSNPVWGEQQRDLRLDLGTSLEVAGVYTLTVDRKAVAQDGTAFDGDADGKPGEINDNFSGKFTGSQQIIRSRLGND